MAPRLPLLLLILALIVPSRPVRMAAQHLTPCHVPLSPILMKTACRI